jgi:hypothetical protein
MTLKLRRPRRHRQNILILPAVLFLSVGLFATLPAHAGIVSSSGVTPLAVAPGTGVHPGDQPPLPTPIIFPEVIGGIAPAGGIAVDHNGSVVVAAPVESANVVNPLLVSSVIPAGTPFDSYLFHFDPADAAIPGAAYFYPLSTVLFSNQIIGVQLFSTGYSALQKPALTPYVGKLEAGDAAVALNSGPPLSYYPGGLIFRGVEEDAMAITSGGFGINLAGEADGAEIDQVRIFVAVPEPNSALLALMGLLGLSFLAIKNARAVRC